MEFIHIHHTSEDYLSNFFQFYSPVFILNTGRSGSALLKKVFDNFHDIKSYHEASPNLFLQSNFAYHNQDKREVLLKIFEASRVELILEAKVENKIFLETNQCLVFFANQIIELFPNAKFIHLTRHPGDFVRSAIRKGWHKNNSVWELGRIKMNDMVAWTGLSQIEKLGWVWSETHAFIEQFKDIFAANCFTIRFEDLIQSYDHFIELIQFIGTESIPSPEDYNDFFSIKENVKVITNHEPPNMFKTESFSEYNDWLEVDKKALNRFTFELSQKYKYHLD